MPWQLPGIRIGFCFVLLLGILLGRRVENKAEILRTEFRDTSKRMLRIVSARLLRDDFREFRSPGFPGHSDHPWRSPDLHEERLGTRGLKPILDRHPSRCDTSRPVDAFDFKLAGFRAGIGHECKQPRDRNHAGYIA